MGERFFSLESPKDDERPRTGGGSFDGGMDLNDAFAVLSHEITELHDAAANESLSLEVRAEAAAGAQRKLDTLVMLITDEANRKYEESKKDGLPRERRMAMLCSALADIEVALALRDGQDGSLELQKNVIEERIADLESPGKR